jgi:gamma-glutamylcyclotransferase (GGCT)/AIG2-like uncharacterized protein YtfP
LFFCESLPHAIKLILLMSDYLFVYGTLQPGFAPGEIAEAAAKLQAVGRGFVYGEFFELDGYPGAVPDPNAKNRIAGTVLQLPENEGILRQLDAYEGYDAERPETSEFVRVRQTVELSGGGTLECWMYRYNREPRA